MWLATYLYRNGLVSADQVLEAAERQVNDRPPIGRLALEQKLMTMHQVAEVLAAQADARKAFGRIAVERGFLREIDVARLLMIQNDRTKPIDDYLVAMGAIDQQTIRDEYARAREEVISENDDTPILGRAV
jgi:hypothetical protein